MASVFKRRKPDGTEAARYTASWKGTDGKYRSQVAYADRTSSMALAVRKETEAAQVRDGIIPASELNRREATRRTLTDHIEDYRRGLLAKGDSPRHAQHIAHTLISLLDDAGVKQLGHLTPDRIQAALGRLRQVRSPRTCNHARGAVKAFGTWLVDNERLEGHRLKQLGIFSEEVDRKRERRALTKAELLRLFEVTGQSGPIDREPPTPNPDRKSTRGGDGSKGRKRSRTIDGPDRLMLYRMACETGFRASELRSLTRESFRLDETPPIIIVEASYTKNGKQARQQIRPAFAADLREWLVTRPESGLVLDVPDRTAALLRHDLESAGIPYKDAKGLVVDFHALRATYITHLIRGGADIKTVQTLARHSTPILTLQRYAKTDDEDKGKALDGL